MIRMKRTAAGLFAALIPAGLFACTPDTVQPRESESTAAPKTGETVETERETGSENTTGEAPDTKSAETLPETDAPVPGMALGFYRRDKMLGARVKMGDCALKWTAGTDIQTFSTFFSTEERLPSSAFSGVFRECTAKIPGAEQFRIGYSVTFFFRDSGETVTEVILSPSDLGTYFSYLEIYLYDDVNQEPGAWYSHLLPEQMTEKTLISSIKLTAGKNIDALGDTITVTAFAYRSEADFGADGSYCGNYQTTVRVTRIY